jgi:hypothetical protein
MALRDGAEYLLVLLRPPREWRDGFRRARLEARARRAIRRVLADATGTSPQIRGHLFYGALELDPAHLVVWFLVATDAEKDAAGASGLQARLERLTRERLGEAGYPPEAVQRVGVLLASEEEIAHAGGHREFFR